MINDNPLFHNLTQKSENHYLFAKPSLCYMKTIYAAGDQLLKRKETISLFKEEKIHLNDVVWTYNDSETIFIELCNAKFWVKFFFRQIFISFNFIYRNDNITRYVIASLSF